MHQGRILETQRLLTPDLHPKSLIIATFLSMQAAIEPSHHSLLQQAE